MTVDRCMNHDRILRKAFEETLDLLGERFKRTIIVDLECAGVYSSNMAYLDLVEIAGELTRIFGKEASQLIMERVFIRMDELESELAGIKNLKKSNIEH